MAATMRIEITTWRHLGDSACLTAAARRIRQALPRCAVRYRGDYQDLFRGLDLGDWPAGAEPTASLKLCYADRPSEERAALGSISAACRRRAEEALGLPREEGPCVPWLPDPGPAPEEYGLPPEYIVANTNCQDNSTTKGYPWWSAALRLLCAHGLRVALIGGREARDVRGDLGALPEGCIDLRGRTTVRQLMAVVRGAACVVSPSSGCVHIAAGYGVPGVVVTGAREPVGLTGYPGMRHIHTICTRCGGGIRNLYRGCIAFRAADGCRDHVEVHGRYYAHCMACIPAEAVVEAVVEAVMKEAR